MTFVEAHDLEVAHHAVGAHPVTPAGATYSKPVAAANQLHICIKLS